MTRSLDTLASPYLAGLIPYAPGKPIEEVEREFGIPDSVKLASNENPLGPSPKALAAIAAALPGLHRYPDGGGYVLRRALGQHWGVDEDCVILGNGSNELLTLVGRAFLMPGDEALYAQQAFVVYDMVAHVSGATKMAVPLRDFAHDLPAMQAKVSAKTKLVFVANPNNPTGAAVDPRTLERFVAALPPDVICVVDEAYYEYLPPDARPDVLQFVRQGRWVLTCRTFSKIYGLAGLRVGYAIGPPVLLAKLNQLRDPFNVNNLAQVAAVAALGDTDHVEKSRVANDAGRRSLTEQFQALGVRVVPSVANFLLVDIGRSGAEATTALLRRGVIVRSMGGYGFPNHLRITIGTAQENATCVAALAAVLK